MEVILCLMHLALSNCIFGTNLYLQLWLVRVGLFFMRLSFAIKYPPQQFIYFELHYYCKYANCTIYCKYAQCLQYLQISSNMAQKTIKISSLPEGITSQQIRSAFQDQNVARIHIIKNKAYVEFQTSDDIDTLEFVCPNNQIDSLNNAHFDRVQPNFKWDSISSDSSSVQQLKEERDFPQKNEQHINLTEPSPQNLITISNCDENVLKNLSQFGIKKNVFGGFHSLNRILKKGKQVIIQLQDPGEAQKLQSVFPNLKVRELGNEAYIDLEAETVNNFAAQWIQQHHKQSQIKSQITEFSHNEPQKKEEQQPKRYLHEDIIPKLNKMTSMETDFLSSQQSSKVTQQEHHHHIPEQSQQHIQTRNQLPNEEDVCFIMEQPVQTGQNDYLLRQAYQKQQAQLKAEEERRQMEEQMKLQKQHEEKQRIRKQTEQKRKNQQQKHKKQEQQKRKRKQEQEQQHRKLQQQRRRKQEQTKQKKLEQQRKKQQEQHQKKILEQQKKKKQEQQNHKKQLEQQTKRKQQQNKKKQEERKKKQEQERKRKQEQERRKVEQLQVKQKQQQARVAQIQKNQQEKKMLEMQIKRQRELEEQERRRKEQLKIEEQRKLDEQKARSQQQRREQQRNKIQSEVINKGNKLVEDAVNAGRDVASKLIGSQQTSRIETMLSNNTKTPIAFWAIIMATMLAMLLL